MQEPPSSQEPGVRQDFPSASVAVTALWGWSLISIYWVLFPLSVHFLFFLNQNLCPIEM